MKTVVATAAKPDLIPLPEVLHHGLLAPGIMGLCSVVSTSMLISLLLYRMFQWRRDHKSFASYNQYIILILNLLVADMLQALSFCLSFHWRNINAILHTDPVCFTQGWFLNLGDTASGLFVFFIAAHTFYATINGRRLGSRLFFSLIGATWFFCVLVTALGPIIRRDKYFTQAGAWCWAAAKWETERLLFHYIEVFVVEFGTVLIYLAVFIYLKRSVGYIHRAALHTTTTARIDRAAKLMIIFPIAYVVLTLPLSAGRMWSMAHKGRSLPPQYACVVGSLMASTGLVDTLLYSLTRRALISSSPTTNNTKSHSSNLIESTRRKSDFLSVPADLLDSKPALSDNTCLAAPNITQTRTVSVTADQLHQLRRTSTSTLPEELEMSYKESRARPPMRTYHSHDPSRGPQRGISFSTLTTPSRNASLMVPSYTEIPLPPLPPWMGATALDVDEKDGMRVAERERNGSTDSASDGKDDKDDKDEKDVL